MLNMIDGKLTECVYGVENEGKHAAVFTTGNGYMGVRGSFEEFGSLRVQGAFVRGFIGSITEVVEPFPDNEYMKNYYLDEQKLKDFEKQDSIINLSDFLLVRVFIDGRPFYPWQGRVVSWKRTLNPATGVLRREVVWENGVGDETEFVFERFASYADKHMYCLRVAVTPLNHNKSIRIVSGIDTKVKTGGQKVTAELSRQTEPFVVQHLKIDNSYAFEACIGAANRFYLNGKELNGTGLDEEGVIAQETTVEPAAGDKLVLEKTVFVWTSREIADPEEMVQIVCESCGRAASYNEELSAHMQAFGSLFQKFDVKIEGDDEADSLLRYANFQTVISADNDGVHSLSAKGLSGEKYNNFVWWDCEIYQLPVFIYTCPELARQALEYRYKLLPQAKRNAQKDGYGGAKYAFCSSVTGEERVWSFTRHPVLQIHIDADIAYAVINYYRVTGDEAFMLSRGLEMLCEIARYWLTRCTYRDGAYHILNVTGPDEHHPYVDNDAYTNYLVQFTLETTLAYCKRFEKQLAKKAFRLDSDETEKVREIAKCLYLPLMENDMIPQFDGYFDLSCTLWVTTGNSAAGFQMKQSGLYHKSQVIKQPDVMLLFNYICRGKARFTPRQYALNWDYYEKQCESASSLSYPVHAIASADNGRMRSFYDYFIETVKIDIDDLHNCAWQGVHSACLAGGWLAIYRGLFGVDMLEDGVHMDPNVMPYWKKVTIAFCYRGERIAACMEGDRLTLQKECAGAIPLYVRGKKVLFRENFLELKL